MDFFKWKNPESTIWLWNFYFLILLSPVSLQLISLSPLRNSSHLLACKLFNKVLLILRYLESSSSVPLTISVLKMTADNPLCFWFLLPPLIELPVFCVVIKWESLCLGCLCSQSCCSHFSAVHSPLTTCDVASVQCRLEGALEMIPFSTPSIGWQPPRRSYRLIAYLCLQ